MKAIETRYLGATNHRPARIVAEDADGNRVSISPESIGASWDGNGLRRPEEVHRAAAEALCKKMNWTGALAGGSTKRGYVFVFVDRWSAGTPSLPTNIVRCEVAEVANVYDPSKPWVLRWQISKTTDQTNTSS